VRSANESATDIRTRLREDHQSILAELDALRTEEDPRQAPARLAQLRRAWVIHALAEETVVYRALESEAAAGTESDARAAERFVEHELVEGLFDKLARTRCGSSEWNARLHVARDLVSRHIETEHEETFSRLAERFGGGELEEIGRRFESARDKLAMLEEAKAA
jgi:hemerythrin superfamily protein